MLFNILNNTIIEKTETSFGELYEEKDRYGDIINSYIKYDADLKLTLEQKLNNFKSIYIPYKSKESEKKLKKNQDVFECPCEEFVIDYRYLNTQLCKSLNVTPIMTPSDLFLLKDSFSDIKFKKIILMCESKFSWSDILYDIKDRVDNLRMVISERAMYISNSTIPFSDIKMLKPDEYISKVAKLEIELVLENLNEGLLDFGNSGYKVDFLEDNKTEIIFTENKRVKKKNYGWARLVDAVKEFTPNIYLLDKEGDDCYLPTSYNKLDEFDYNNHSIIFSKSSSSKIELSPIIDIMFKSIDTYKDAIKINKNIHSGNRLFQEKEISFSNKMKNEFQKSKDEKNSIIQINSSEDFKRIMSNKEEFERLPVSLQKRMKKAQELQEQREKRIGGIR